MPGDLINKQIYVHIFPFNYRLFFYVFRSLKSFSPLNVEFSLNVIQTL